MKPGLPPRPDFLPPGFGTVGHADFVEIAVPAPASYMPQTWGWYVLAGLILIGIAVGAWRAVARYRKNAYRREALRELAALRLAAGTDRPASIEQVPGLLKRCALAAFPRQRVASLSGPAWLAFLDETAPGALSPQAQRTLQDLVVRPPAEVPVAQDQELFDGVERWMRRHHA